MAAGAVQQACAAALADGCRPDVDHHGEHVVDWTAKLGDPANPTPTIHAAFGYAAQLAVVDRATGQGRAGRRRPRRRQGGQPAAVRGPDRGQRAHGARLRADRGVPDRSRDRVPDVLDAAPARHPAGQGRPGRSRSSWSRCPSRGSPYGIKGVGEIGLVPTAPAVAAALHDLDGEWRTTLPMKPAQVS